MRFKRAALVVLFFACCVTLTQPASALTIFFWDINGNQPGAGSETPNGFWIANPYRPGLYSNDSDQVKLLLETIGDEGREQYMAAIRAYEDATTVAGGWRIHHTWGTWERHGLWDDGSWSDAVFANGTDATGQYTVTVVGRRQLRRVFFNSGTPTIEGGALEFFNTDEPKFVYDGGVISVSSGRTAFIKSPILRADTGTNGVGITKIRQGTLVLSGTNVHSGPIRVEGGRLALGASETFNSQSILVLANGGLEDIEDTPATFSLAGFSQTFRELRVVGGEAKIDFGGATGSLIITEKGEAGEWSGDIVTITNYVPDASSFRVGTDGQNFQQQLTWIEFADYKVPGNFGSAVIDSNGYVKPNANAPVITTPPQSQTAVAGSAVAFSVTANNGEPFTYQWQRNVNGFWNNLQGATSSTLSLDPVSPFDAGTYRVLVSNAAGTTRSREALLTVNKAPPGEIKILSITKVSEGYTLRVQLVPFYFYGVEYNPELGFYPWQPLGGEFFPQEPIADFLIPIDHTDEVTSSQGYFQIFLAE